MLSPGGRHCQPLWKIHHPGEKGVALSGSSFAPAESGPHSLCGMPPQNPSSQWLVLYTTPRHEKRINQQLELRQIDCFLPLYRTQRRWNDGSRVTLELPLFPGYLFVRVSRHERSSVLALPGALKFVAGMRSEPAALVDSEIEILRSGLHQRRAEPHPLLVCGRWARIRCGPLAGLQGVITRWKNGLRVVLTLELIARSVAVEVNGDELDPVETEFPELAQDQFRLAG